MGDKRIRQEFEQFIKELTVEICSNVCLEKIEKVNNSYEKNNKQFIETSKKIENIIIDNKNGIKELNDINSKGISELTKKYEVQLGNIECEFKKVQAQHNEIFSDLKDEFDVIIKKAIENEETREKTNEVIIEIAKELMGSHDVVDAAFKEVKDKNSELLNKLLEKSEQNAMDFKRDVQLLNSEERDKFIKCLSDSINKEKETLTNDIVNNTKKDLKTAMEQFIKSNKDIENKITSLINGNEIQNNFKSINDSLIKSNDKISELKGKLDTVNNTLVNKIENENKKIANEIINKSVDNTSEVKNDITKSKDEIINLIKKENLKIDYNIKELNKKIDILEQKNKKLELYVKGALGGLGIIALLIL